MIDSAAMKVLVRGKTVFVTYMKNAHILIKSTGKDPNPLEDLFDFKNSPFAQHSGNTGSTEKFAETLHITAQARISDLRCLFASAHNSADRKDVHQ
jgi:hypothetical protein